jgi:hypothetical protein
MYFSYLANRRTTDSHVEYRFNKFCKQLGVRVPNVAGSGPAILSIFYLHPKIPALLPDLGVAGHDGAT